MLLFSLFYIVPGCLIVQLLFSFAKSYSILFFCLICVLLTSRSATWARVSVWLIIGVLVYVFYGRTHSSLLDAVYVPAAHVDEIYRSSQDSFPATHVDGTYRRSRDTLLA